MTMMSLRPPLRRWRLVLVKPEVPIVQIRAFSSKGLDSIPSVCTSFVNNGFLPVRPAQDAVENYCPASGKALCQMQFPSKQQVDFAIHSSEKAFHSDWSRLSFADRGHILKEMARGLQQDEQHLVELEALDTGIPTSQIRVNHIPYAMQTLEYYASICLSGGLPGKTFETTNHSFSYTRREALGVCAAIGAFNYPLVSMIWKVAPALACGNTVIYKPSECTPLTALRAAGVLWKDVLPRNILQVLVGESTTAQQLVTHAHVQKVSITGSTETGISVAQASAATLKRPPTLELGGKSPLLIFADADMESAVRVAVDGNFANNGQVCSNCTRVYVERSILEDFVSRVVSRVKKTVVIGDNFRDDVNLGPLIMPPRHPSGHYERVMRLIDSAKLDPLVELLYGGNGYAENGGFYVEPTIFLAKSDNEQIVREEVFGPVMTVLAFDTEEEAIARANDTPYGLAAGVMTKDIMRAHRVSKRLVAGNVWVNNWNTSPVEMPFGGYRMSGYGKELGIEALESYSQVKNVFMEIDGIDEESALFKRQ